ncbi:MAG: putative membrane protein YqgA involved in biofilm formation [Flavobacteriales bacterium]|jgi:uncharacterized membrane protein YqgA involved in biofilm formation
MEMILPIGTFVNVATVLAGGLIGLSLRKVFPEKIKEIIFQGIGLFVLVLGAKMAFATAHPLVQVVAIVTGGVIGVWVNLDVKLNLFSARLKVILGSKESTFNEGLITAFLLFCVGSMTIVGAMNEGISGDRDLLFTKSIMDGISAIVLAASFGSGVIFSVIPMLLFQGGITLLATQMQGYVSEAYITEVSAVGGLMILGIGLNVLGITKLKVVNMLPALATVLLWMWVQSMFL